MNKVKETSVNQLDMGSLTQIKSFDEEIKKLSEILVKLNPVTEELSNRIANLRNDASYYNGMISSDTSAFQEWFKQSNYNTNVNNFINVRTLINNANNFICDESVSDDTCSDSDYSWMDACGESLNCYYDASCNQTCSYTPDCNETTQDGYTIEEDGGVVCTLPGEGCTEECGECGEAIPDPISECALPGCDDAGCMEQIACGELCTETIDCDQTVCDVCSYGQFSCDFSEVDEDCGFVCSFTSEDGKTPEDCSYSCIYSGTDFPTDCTYTCLDGGCTYGGSCSYNSGAVDIPCDEQVNCNQTITCTQPCGLTVCDDSAGCGETCDHNAEDCGDCFFGGCEAGDGDCGDCADCAEECGDGWCSHDCADGTDVCGEDCGDSCGL